MSFPSNHSMENEVKLMNVDFALRLNRPALILLATLLFGWSGTLSTTIAADGETFYTIPAIDVQREHVLIHIPIEALPEGSDKVAEVVLSTPQDDDVRTAMAQIGGPWLLDPQDKPYWVTFVAKNIKANQAINVAWGEAPEEDGAMAWSEDKKTLRYGDVKLLSLEDAAFDDSSPESRDLTYKVFHHLYAPRMSAPITKGPGGLFPHHRGLFYGFNKIGLETDGKQVEVDTWHAKKAHQESRGVKVAEAGPVFGRHVCEIAWINEVAEPDSEFATEMREIVVFTAFKQMGIQFSSRLKSNAGTVSLKGDPQHAGFQFRASQEVADVTKDQTYYIRPDGKAKPGEFRNWPDQKDHVDLPYHAMSFVLDDRRLTCLRLDRKANPHPARFSERNYGRFGSYFEYQLEEDKPLEVKYQLRLFLSEIEQEQAETLSNGFAGQ